MRWVVGAMAVAALAGSAVAADTVVFSHSGDGTTNGGAFGAVTSAHGSFQTFCIETNEFLNLGTTYFYEISDAAMFGGHSGGNPDPISNQTKHIYYAFRTGMVASILGINEGDGLDSVERDQIADAVQKAIWHLEGENGGANTGNSGTLITWANNTIGGGGLAGANGVRVLNVWKHATNRGWDDRAQDQLILVPLPSACGLAFTALFGLAAVRRRKI